MFGLSKPMLFVLSGLAIATVTLGGLTAIQSAKIDSLKKDVKEKDELLEAQEVVNQKLITHLEAEKQAVEKQQQIANELKVQMETERENVKTVLIKEPCGNVAVPRDVIDSIKRLHTKGSNKN
ncbi:DUF2570 family protein [Actinobacillus pleuropneumoniae]|uniref:DUF2570 family protein n=1 Tax=Actinobacillus pleuropneumoniae TaxID=715 RepID=UPI002ECB8996|nr:DUF2570 family protein [Actinobacillus pleuropneumoniae]